MKKLISNQAEGVLEVAKQMTYSLKVLVIGLFIPFTFIFGISYNRHTVTEKSGVSISKQKAVVNDNTVEFVKVLPDQNS